LRFVRFSGQALTQGVVNTRIDGVPVRIYSAAKTIADCLSESPGEARYAIVELFVLSWLVSMAVYKCRAFDRIEIAEQISIRAER
jgi:high-affinity nickel permease